MRHSRYYSVAVFAGSIFILSAAGVIAGSGYSQSGVSSFHRISLSPLGISWELPYPVSPDAMEGPTKDEMKNRSQGENSTWTIDDLHITNVDPKHRNSGYGDYALSDKYIDRIIRYSK